MKCLLLLLAAIAVSDVRALNLNPFKSDGPEKILDNVNVFYKQVSFFNSSKFDSNIFSPVIFLNGKKYFFHSRNMTNVIYLPLRDLPNLLADKNFDKTAPSVVYVHGWMESGRMDLSVLAVRGAYLDRGDHNVISIDWSYYSKNIQYHVSVVPQLKVIAETIAEAIYSLVKNGLDINTPGLHLVGHSLGYERKNVELS